MNSSNIWAVMRQTFTDWSEDEAPRLGAALAFYTVLSLAPLVVLVVSIVGMFFGSESAQTQLMTQVEAMVGNQGAEAVRTMIQAQHPATGTFASIIGMITLLFGAAGVFGELRAALNKMWDVKTETQSGIMAILRQRFFSFGMVFAVGFLLLVSMVISAALAALGTYFKHALPMPEWVLSLVNFAISLAATTILFALIFKYVPERQIAFNRLWLGSIVTALMFTVGKSLIGLYLGKASVGSAYGAAGSLVVVIVWVYYSAMIFLLGAEFTHTVAEGIPDQVPQERLQEA